MHMMILILVILPHHHTTTPPHQREEKRAAPRRHKVSNQVLTVRASVRVLRNLTDGDRVSKPQPVANPVTVKYVIEGREET